MTCKVYLENDNYRTAGVPMHRAEFSRELSGMRTADDVRRSLAPHCWIWLCVLDRPGIVEEPERVDLFDEIALFVNDLCFEAPECFADKAVSQNIAVFDDATPAAVIEALLESDRCGLVFDETGKYGEPFIEMDDILEAENLSFIDEIEEYAAIPEFLAFRASLLGGLRGLSSGDYSGRFRFQYKGEIDDDTAWKYAATVFEVTQSSSAALLVPLVTKALEVGEFEGVVGDEKTIREDHQVVINTLIPSLLDEDEKKVWKLLQERGRVKYMSKLYSISPLCLEGHPDAVALMEFCERFPNYIIIWSWFLMGKFGSLDDTEKKRTVDEMIEEGGLDIIADSCRNGIPLETLLG